jgi:hypothetical protein
MTRVCLDCGTPKRPYSERCLVCKDETFSHEGEARKSLCHRCKFVTRFDGHIHCGFTRNNHTGRHHRPGVKGVMQRGANHSVDRILDLTVDYEYNCGDFMQAYDQSTVPSPNPLSVEEMLELARYYENPLAFWLSPTRWDHVVDLKEDMFWMEPRKPLGKLARGAMVAGLLGIAVAGFLKVDKKTPGLA